MWLVWTLLCAVLLCAVIMLIASISLTNMVLKPRRFGLDEVEALEIERGNLKEGQLATLPLEEGELIASDGVRLSYCYYRAKVGEVSDKVCILVHGFWTRREAMLKLAPIYRERGYDVLLFHHRNCGDSGGNMSTMGFMERRDLGQFIELARKERAACEKCTVGLHGESMGGATVLLAACALGADAPDFVVADCPYADLREQLVHSIGYLKKLPAGPFMALGDRLLRLRGGFCCADVSPINELRLRGGLEGLPMLFIHGTGDKLIPYESTLRLYEAKRGKKELYLCEGAGHVHSIVEDRAAFRRTVDAFLDKYGF